ncbi:DEAD/DEAH box helicase [Nocardia sp. NRRL S-836]|uniref:DEAD/DEAH box helicase n=1 Tax=Nocardia sp. NRRL S-836 TaxID=1519492 RepID=UPI0006AF98BF|nr:AAA domain-containing protein [Nocardia sp. NRRL S-836]
MQFRPVVLPTAVTLVPSRNFHEILLSQAKTHPGMPASLDQLVFQLNERRTGVAATVDEPKKDGGDPSLLLYGTTWVLRLYPTRHRDGYLIASIDPLRIRHHHRIAHRCLIVRPPSWQRVFEIRMLPQGASAHWERVLAEWFAVDTHQPIPVARPDPAHTRFLDVTAALIEANQRITTGEARCEQPFPYREVAPIGERRHGAASMYEFRLAGDRVPEQDTFVQVRGEPEQRGQVTRVDGRAVVVRFDQPVDFHHLEQTGALEVTLSTVVFDKQREAVATLRAGQSLNPRLLSAFVDHDVLPFTEPAAEPAERLDVDQLVAFRKALAVPDVLLVLGPPGTGKTRVISQSADAVARARQRVLITAHTNRAVDNVLARIPGGLVVVRVGNEGVVTEEGRPYLLEHRSAELRQVILNQTGYALSRSGDLDVAAKWADELADRTAGLLAALDAESRARTALHEARRAAGGELTSTVDSLVAGGDRLAHRLGKLSRAGQRYTRWRTVLGGLFASWCDKRTQVLHARFTELSATAEQYRRELVEAERRLQDATAGAPAVRAAEAALAAVTGQVATARADAMAAADATRAAVGALDVPPEADDLAGLRALVAWAAERLPVLRSRARLLGEWRDEVAGASKQLHPELIRYADVIACTAIGAASRSELSDVDFDLAIVDEAGQIGVADVLVPLVRARRAVLVGDHQQLPPFLDSEVEAWGEEAGDPAVRRLLTKSALELAVDGFPATNVVPLRQQRRMPAVIADFVSQEFYRRTLCTAVEREHDDPLFRSAFAFVDTSRLPASERGEKPAAAADRGLRGVHNPAEARLLSRLAARYDERGVEWAVIVPYRAQVKAISAALLAVLGDERKVRLNVGTVDSFQGGERDVVLYGFTRSNPDGLIGFLRELRRANVAFTRAKQQLVLVGDLSTLTTARDEDFREFARRMRDHVARHGDIRQYDEIIGKLG